MPLTLKQYWEALDTSLKEFDNINIIKAQDEKDEKGYQKQRTFLNTMLKLGIEIEKTTWTILKTKNGIKLQSLPGETFGKEQVVTNFEGPLSVAFAQQVYLPYLKRFDEVTFVDQNETLKILSNLPQQKKDVLILVEKLDKAIKSYNNVSSVLTSAGLYSPKNPVPTSDAEAKELKKSGQVHA